VAIFSIPTYDQFSWSSLAAAALIVALPVLLLTTFVPRQNVVGVTAGRVTV
jgi:ABC-type glycerol-3-phosphate transport system permease component